MPKSLRRFAKVLSSSISFENAGPYRASTDSILEQIVIRDNLTLEKHVRRCQDHSSSLSLPRPMNSLLIYNAAIEKPFSKITRPPSAHCSRNIQTLYSPSRIMHPILNPKSPLSGSAQSQTNPGRRHRSPAQDQQYRRILRQAPPLPNAQRTKGED